MSYRELRAIAEQVPDLGVIRRERPYRFPKGYIHWDTVSAMLALALAMGWEAPEADLATCLHNLRSALWLAQNAPVYCLSKELLDTFRHTDVRGNPGLLAGLNPPLPTFMLLFPDNTVHTSTGVLHYVVCHIGDKQHPERSKSRWHGRVIRMARQVHDVNIHWSGCDSADTVWFAGADSVDDDENTFLNEIRSVVLQTLLVLTYKPELLEEVTEPTRDKRKRSGGKQEQESDQVMRPRWLGKNYVSQAVKTHSGKSKGTHASPNTHWRRGHWREAAVGVGRKETKMILIPPTLVNGDKA